MSNIIKKKQIVDTERGYYKLHLTIINSFLPIKLTSKEIEILSEFMRLEGDIKEDRFGTTGRKMVMESLSLSHGSLGNHLKNLKDKGFIIKITEDIYDIPLILYPNKEEQNYMFKIEIKK